MLFRSQGQTSFAFSYYPGYIEVFVNGTRLTDSEYIATNGVSVIIKAPCVLGDTIDLISYTMGQGVQGIQGLQGPTGFGLQGSQGISGAFAGQGISGSQGLQGLQGPAGFGLQGSQGTQGVQGLQGSIGSQGHQGLQGTIGIQGPVGYVDNAPAKTSATYTATPGQTTFSFTYFPGYIEVFVNGGRLSDSDYLATNGTTVTIPDAVSSGDIVDLIQYTMGQGVQGIAGQGLQGTQGLQGGQGLSGAFAGQGVQGAIGFVQNVPAKTSVTYSATSGQTTFAFNYFPGYIEVFVNGVRLTDNDYIATNGTTVVLKIGRAHV